MSRFPSGRPLHGRDPRIGVVYPCSGTRDADFWALAPPGASVHLTRLPFESQGTVEAVGTMSSDQNLMAAANLLAQVEPAVLAWADTSGSFLFGPGGDLRQIALLTEASRAPATTTSTGMVEACRAAGVEEVDVASPYIGELNDAFVAFLGGYGIRVGELQALELVDSYEIASIPEEVQKELVCSVRGRAGAVLVPCTDFFTLSLIPALEAQLDRLIIAANAATMWHAAQLVGGDPTGANRIHGRLFGLRAK